MGTGESEQGPAAAPSRGEGEAGVGSDDEIRELFRASEVTPAAPNPRRDALRLSAAVIAVIVVMVVALAALVAALPYLIEGGIWLLFAADPCQDWLHGCG